MKKISFLIPCYNEEESLPGLYAELVGFVASKATVRVTGDAGETLEQTLDMTGYEWEFLMVNDGSRDSTLDRLEELRSRDDRVSVLNLSRNFGKENAMLAGMDYFSGDALIIIDADLQDPLSVVPEMIYWNQGSARRCRFSSTRSCSARATSTCCPTWATSGCSTAAP